jgi:hypothetical protein
MRTLLSIRLTNLIAFLLIFLFVYTAGNKLFSHATFTAQLRGYPLLKTYRQVFSWVVPVAELLVAGLLLLPPYRLIGLYASLILLSLFTCYVLLLMVVAAGHLPCPCGGILSTMSWPGHMAFNTACIGLTVIAIWSVKKRKTIVATT